MVHPKIKNKSLMDKALL